MSKQFGHEKREVTKMMFITTTRGSNWSRYLTTRLFVLLLKVQGQYFVRRALVEATSKMSATAPKPS